MPDTEARSDMGLGLGLVFAVVAFLAAATMYLGSADHLVAGWAFAIAMVAGSLGIAALHLYAQ